MGNLLYRLGLRFVLTSVGILLIGALPSLFHGIHLDVASYMSTLKSVFTSLIHPDSLVYEIRGISRPLFPKILDPWGYSLTLLFTAFLAAFAAALAATFCTMLLSKKARERIKFFLFMLESLPDVLVIAIFILVVIWLYDHTDILFFNIAAFGQDKAYALPILVLTILPAVMLYRTMILDFEAETEKPYVELAKAKGMKKSCLLFVHIFRNAIISIFLHSKFILWFLLSNLLVVEYVFNIHGLMFFMFTLYSPVVLTIGLFLLFVPIYFMFSIGQMIVERLTAQKVAM
ncbi:MAG TPA: ABC transporter permease subunit [Bacillales bacterium]|nr:ABC transporter permease subunit [Bacillales bacterium]